MTVRYTIEREVKQVIHQIPPLPGVVLHLVELVDSENATADQVESLITVDPVLSVKVLHIANSAYYGLSRSIYTIKQAVLVLGFHTLKNLVLGISAIAVLKNGRKPSAVETTIWEHSFVCAGIARELMARAKQPLRKMEEAFMGGLLHEIGAIVLMTRFPKEYQRVLERASQGIRQTLLEAEREMLGTDHAEVGGYLAEHWKLPTNLAEVIAGHHAPVLPECDNKAVLAGVMLGDYWSHLHAGAEELGFELTPPPLEAEQLFGLADSERALLIERVAEQTQSARQILEL